MLQYLFRDIGERNDQRHGLASVSIVPELRVLHSIVHLITQACPGLTAQAHCRRDALSVASVSRSTAQISTHRRRIDIIPARMKAFKTECEQLNVGHTFRCVIYWVYTYVMSVSSEHSLVRRLTSSELDHMDFSQCSLNNRNKFIQR